jgi:hypothetical protein
MTRATSSYRDLEALANKQVGVNYRKSSTLHLDGYIEQKRNALGYIAHDIQKKLKGIIERGNNCEIKG